MNRHSELIFLYLDGQTTPSQQQELFEAMSQNPDLQREFHQALELYRAIEAERLTTVAPPEIKQAVYAAVGLTPAPSLVRRLIPYVSLVGGIATIAIGLTLWRGTDSPPAAPVVTPARPVEVRSLAAAPSHRLLPVPTIPAAADLQQPTSSISTGVEQSPEAPPIVFGRDEEFTLDRYTPITAASPMQRNARWRIGMVHLPVFSTSTGNSALLTTHLSYRGSLLAASGPAATPQNFSITALYRLDENNRIGLEFRRAPYTLNIAQPSGTLTTVTASSLALTYSFTEPEVRILGGMPFVQPSIGYTQYGPLASFTAGLSFPITNDLRFTAGLDASALLHSAQVASTLSVAIGVNVGLPIR